MALPTQYNLSILHYLIIIVIQIDRKGLSNPGKAYLYRYRVYVLDLYIWRLLLRFKKKVEGFLIWKKLKPAFLNLFQSVAPLSGSRQCYLRQTLQIVVNSLLISYSRFYLPCYQAVVHPKTSPWRSNGQVKI